MLQGPWLLGFVAPWLCTHVGVVCDKCAPMHVVILGVFFQEGGAEVVWTDPVLVPLCQ